MEDILLEEGAGDGYDVPEHPHIEIVFDGLNDTLDNVSGNESLTQAQHYLIGAMNAAGVLRTADVTGNESMFSAIGSGVTKAFEYIKNMFKSIYEFFFKRDGPKMVEDTKKDLNDHSKLLDVVSTGGSNEQETEKVLAKQISALKALGNESDTNKSALDQILKEADEAHKSGSQAEKKKAVVMIGRELPKLNSKAKKILGGKIDQLVAALKAFLKVVDDALADEATTTLAKDALKKLGTEKQTQTQLIAKLESVRDIKNVAAAKDVLTAMVKDIGEFEVMLKDYRQMEGHIGEQIRKLEAMMKENAKEDKVLKASLGDLRGLMTVISKITQVFKAIFSRMVSTQVSVNAMFGV